MTRAVKKKIHTHYDNLKVARNAPDEVIRASYKALSQKYHPDKNSRPDAARIMAILNSSYAVLSDEVQRRRHDDWIVEQERALAAPRSALPPPRRDVPLPERAAPPASSYNRVEPILGVPAWRSWSLDTPRQLVLLLCGVLALTIAVLSLIQEQPEPPLPFESSAPVDTASPEEAASWKKPNGGSLAPFKTVTVAPTKIRFGVGPDGRPWPLGPKMYREGGLQLGGQLSITIDNSHNAHPVYVKIRLDSKQRDSELYIPRHRLFSIEDLVSGVYRLRYRDLQTGVVMQSNPLVLADVNNESAEQGVLNIVLRAAPNDSRDFHVIAEDEF